MIAHKVDTHDSLTPSALFYEQLLINYIAEEYLFLSDCKSEYLLSVWTNDWGDKFGN